MNLLDKGGLAHFWAQIKPSIQGNASDIAGVEARVEVLEMALMTGVTGNPFTILFDDLDGLKVSGVWNQNDRKIEF